jgi:hypothetical protein
MGLAIWLFSGASAMAGPRCESLFQSQSAALLQVSATYTNQLFILTRILQKRHVLKAYDVTDLNSFYNRWLKITDEKFELIDARRNSETLSAEERIETLELMQSIYDSYFNVLQPLHQNTKWRRILDRADSGRTDNAFADLQETVFSKEFFSFYQDLLERTADIRSVYDEIEGAEFFLPSELEKMMSRVKVRNTFIKIRDLLRRSFENSLAAVTEVIGTTSDTFPLRAGKLFGRADVYNDFVRHLQPMDILLDRANEFKLSHMIIPGYFGHTGIYLGTKQQLIERGLWDDPVIVPFHEEIEQGYTMLESKRTGTKLRKLSDYFNTDSVTAIRQRNIGIESMREKIHLGLSQIGKTFDHTFDLEHSASFFCSKLIYFVFRDIEWPVRWAVGRYSVPPDYIASKMVGFNPSFDPVLIYEKGQRVEDDMQLHVKRIQGIVPR